MNVDEKQEIYQKGFQAGTEHRTSAPKTLEEVTNLKINFARMEQKLDNLITLVEGITANKADKWTEKAIYGIIGSFATLLIGLVIFLLTK